MMYHHIFKRYDTKWIALVQMNNRQSHELQNVIEISLLKEIGNDIILPFEEGKQYH
jgi:hypothetical protein